ncbi:hypothetical protein C922_02988 [Plasmodium inui San Antonio 1]|uniref:inositol-pentakisphosphate 2-kinase n=1 Tax=Plasmodium inui San Antonio 1 TaxID=1237626 RepID=W7A0H0_9APIC|nr:hypothetical protein C922_02988 [Plasmodium inui San Antonio 1]EUD66667.1 hypothetical protein C922_02988 [Plasmodium inui San Antonio 1]
MEGTLEIIGEGNKMIVLKQTSGVKIRPPFNDSRGVAKSGRTPTRRSLSPDAYFHILRHIHFYSYIFLKNSVIKVVKENEVKNVNITLQYYWLNKICYRHVKIFEKNLLVNNNFVVFDSQFSDFVGDSLYWYTRGSTLPSRVISRANYFLFDGMEKIRTYLLRYYNRFLAYLKENSAHIAEDIWRDMKAFIKHTTDEKKLHHVKSQIVSYLKQMNYKDLFPQVLHCFEIYIKRLKHFERLKKRKKKMISTGKVIFKTIYDSHNFIYRNKSRKSRIGYVEENLFSIPSFLLQTGGNIKTGESQVALPEDSAMGEASELTPNINFSDQYISVELKFKCGMEDYNDMLDRYNIQQLIKQRKDHSRHLSLYVPSNFFQLNYWEIFKNLNFVFLSHSNNVNLYVNGRKRVDMAMHSADHFKHLFYGDPLGPFNGGKDPQGKLYLVHLNSQRGDKSALPCGDTENASDAANRANTEAPSPEGEAAPPRGKRTGDATINDCINQLNQIQMKMSWKYANKYNILDYCHRVGSDPILEEGICGLLAQCTHEKRPSLKWPHRRSLSYSGLPYSNYAYRNYIFSNKFFFKYFIPCTCQELRSVLLSLKKGDYCMCIKKLVAIFDTYKDIYYLNLIALLNNAAHIICERCAVVAPRYLHDSSVLPVKRRENPLWNVNLVEREKNKGESSSSSGRHHGNQRRNRATVFILPSDMKCPLREWKRDLLLFIKEAKTDKTKWKKIFKGRFTHLRELYTEMSDTYRSILNKLQEDYLTMFMQKLRVQKKTWNEMRIKVEENFIHRVKHDFVYLYDGKVKTNYYYNWFITNRFTLTVKLYFQQCQYLLGGLLNYIQVMCREKGYEQRVSKMIAHLQCSVKKALSNYKSKYESSFEIGNISHFIERQGGNASLINYLLFHKNKLNTDRFIIQTSEKTERLVMLTNIIEKEKFLFYKLLYFHCFSAGQVQIVHCMLRLIKTFERLFFLKKSEDIFSSFAYYRASLENFTSPERKNSYIARNRHLSRFIDVKRLRRLSQCVLSSAEEGTDLTNTQATNQRGTPKHAVFTYLQNTHFLLGNELLIDAIGTVNKYSKSKLAYVQSEMKNRTRKLYYGLYRNMKQYGKKYTPMYKPRLRRKVNRRKLIGHMLSSRTLITMDHFDYLTSEPFKSRLDSNTIIVNRKKDIPKKALRIYKNMIFFVCRFLISRTLCDNSTIFNIYAKEDNRYDDAELLQTLEANRFKPLIVMRRGRRRRPRGVSSVTYANGVENQDGNAIQGENAENGNQQSGVPTILCAKRKNKKYIPTKRFTSNAYPLRSTHLRREKERCSREDNRQFQKVVENAYMPRGSKKIFYRISLIDLSMKSLSKMSYWEKQMCQIISLYKTLCEI